ncbi:MAG: hypothetical protein ACREDU_03140, partial [Methylocella sp.]
MTIRWAVLKFGGTSVSGRPQWEAIARLVRARWEQGWRVVLVCSAVTGVTDDLSALADEPASGTKAEAVLERHRRLAAELGVPETGWLCAAAKVIHRCRSALEEGTNDEEKYAARAELLGQGEWLSTRIGGAFLKEFIPVSWVDVRTVLRVQEEPELSPARQWLSASCEPGFSAEMARDWEQLEPIVIT